MSTDYADLVQRLTTAVEGLQQALPSTDNPSDLAQAHLHLSKVTEMLWEIDQDEPETPGADAALSQAGAIAQNVCDHVVDMPEFSEVDLQVTALEEALDAIRVEGFSAPDPGDMEWYEGDEPTDGSDF